MTGLPRSSRTLQIGKSGSRHYYITYNMVRIVHSLVLAFSRLLRLHQCKSVFFTNCARMVRGWRPQNTSAHIHLDTLVTPYQAQTHSLNDSLIHNCYVVPLLTSNLVESIKDPMLTTRYWWKFIEEGLEMGKKIEKIIEDRAKRQV
jgi:hypothetical protein